MPSNSVVSDFISPSPSPSPSSTASTSSNNWSPPSTLTSSKRLKNNGQSVISILEDQESPSPSSQTQTRKDTDNSGALYWNASLLYYTGLAISPKIKAQNLRSSVSMSDMHRPRSPASRKHLTKSPSTDSGTGTYSTMSSCNDEEHMSPLRRRHLSCGSTSTASSSSMGSLKGKMKNSSTTTSSSMRLMKVITRRPSLSSFMEKTQSLGRYNRNKSASPVAGDNDTIHETVDSSSTPANAPASTSSSSGLGSATAKVFRDSFRAAKNLLPSSTKLTNSSKSGITKAVSSISLSSASISAKSHSITNSSSTNTINYSAPNSPKKVTGRKSFADSFSNFRKNKGGSAEKDQTIKAVISESITQSEDNTITTKGSKTESLDSAAAITSNTTGKESVGGSKSISSKLKKNKDKDSSTSDKKETKDTVEKVPSKKVSLVKSLTRKIRNKREKESVGSSSSTSKDLPLMESTTSKSKTKSKSVAEPNKKSASPEILQLDNEPRVRTPKSLRQRRSTTSTPEKDREFSEMEVSEEALEISREKKLSQESDVTNKSQKKAKEQKKSQSSSSVISEEGKKDNNNSSNKAEKANKNSRKETESSSVSSTQQESTVTNNTSALSGESTQKTTSLEGKVTKSQDMPSTSKNIKKGKSKTGKRKKSVESPAIATVESKTTSETLLDTKLDLEVDDGSGNGEIKERPADHNNQMKLASARSSDADAKSEDHNSAPISSDVTDAQHNEQFNSGPEESSNINPEDRCIMQEIHVTITSSQENNYTKLQPESTNTATKSANNDVAATEEKVDAEGDDEFGCTDSFRQLKPFNFNLDPIVEGKRERLYKVLVVGELGAGKTSIIKRYVHQFFSQHYRATIGVDFALKVLRWDPDTVVRLQLWDIAGQERFGSMTRVYYKEAVGAFVVFDVTRAATLEAVPKWKADLDSKVALPDGRPIPTVLLANKSDQPKEGIAANREKMNDFCQQQGFAAWFETSAKDNINIDESANFLVSKILEMDRWSQEPLSPDPDKVDLSANGKHKPSAASNCAC